MAGWKLTRVLLKNNTIHIGHYLCSGEKRGEERKKLFKEKVPKADSYIDKGKGCWKYSPFKR